MLMLHSTVPGLFRSGATASLPAIQLGANIQLAVCKESDLC